jgi:hypothetical protein
MTFCDRHCPHAGHGIEERCTHPIGTNGQRRTAIGLWDYQEGVPGRGDARLFRQCGLISQATSPVQNGTASV